MKEFYKASKEMIERKDLSDSEKMLVMVLQGLSERQGYCFATNAKLASMVGWSIDKLRNNLRTLGEKGIVAYELEDGNRRKLTLPQGGVQFNTEGGVQNDTGGCEDLNRGVCESTQGGVQNDTPLHNRTSNITDNRPINRAERVNADESDQDFFDNFSEAETEKEKVPPKRKRFEPPTEMQVQAFFQTTASPNSWSAFYNYYLANGWKVGKNPMKDWHAAARGWVARQNEFTKPQTNGRQQPNTEQLARSLADGIASGKYDITKG
jgi:hypothetical protein